MTVYESEKLKVCSVKKIEMLSLAKTLGVLHAVVGFIIGLLMSLASLTGLADPDRLLFGSASVVVLPIVNFILGFVGGVLIALIYNFIGPMLGGIKIYLHDES